MKTNTRKTGSVFEELAAAYLAKKGHKIRERNFRNRFGEIDIISETKNGTIVMTEVKYRAAGSLEALEAVTYTKRRQISRIALFYLNKIKAAENTACRFDVIGIDREGNIAHIENAFDYAGQ